MSERRFLKEDLPYDKSDPESIIRYASKLTGNTLSEMMDIESGIIGGTRSKGYFGQRLETGYFFIDNDNSPEPDFMEAGLELKSAPVKRTSKGIVAKERLVLCIINYEDVPVKGFKIFTDKDSRILMIFYLWEEDTDIYKYKVVKVVDWSPNENELRMIRDDWDVIEGYVRRGEAHMLSERHTKLLAACTKGAGHDRDMRVQPFSDILAKQRALSFKQSFMTEIYKSHIDVGESLPQISKDYNGQSIIGVWDTSMTFEEHVISKFERFVGMTCREIEKEIGISLDSKSKQYYHTLTLAMVGVTHGRYVKEFEDANILMKTARIRLNGCPKESMSFPAFKYDEIANQTWEESDLYGQLDHEFFIPVFGFTINDWKSQDRKDLVFKGAFFWSMPDDDFKTVEGVWHDTKEKILSGDFDNFVHASDKRISHVRPHGKDSNDTVRYKGRDLMKRSFWLNQDYLKMIIDKNLKGQSGLEGGDDA